MSGLRVLLDTSYRARGETGTGIYIERVAIALREAGVAVIEAANTRRGAPGGGTLSSVRNYASDRAWTAGALPGLALRAGAHVIHHPLPAFTRLAPCRQVVTVHDLAFQSRPELFDRRYASWAARAHRAAARAASAVICVSEATRADVVERWGVAVERTVVARHGAGQLEGVTIERAADPRHFLYVGDDEPRKNLDALLDAYAAYRGMRGARAAPLVLAGKTSRPATDGVELVARPSRERLAALHADAIALVHPAVEEGFGLTLLEALAAGTPVIAARSRAAIEVCGDDAAVLLAGADRDELVAQLAVQLAAIQFDVSKRDELTLAGRARSLEFSWAASARAHIQAYTLAAR